MDIGVKPHLSDQARQEKLQARAKELMLQHECMVEYLLPGGPAWGPPQVEIRDSCFAAAQAELDVEYYVYAGLKGDDDQVDWAQPVREGLRQALAERDLALQVRDQAESVYRRAKTQLDDTRAQLAQYDDLEQRIRDYTVDQLKSGHDTELNYGLKQDKSQQSRLMDRCDIASGATTRLESELRTAEQRLGHKLRVCNIWATKVLLEYAQQCADELAAAQAKVDALRNDLLGLSYTPLPSQQGPTPLPHHILTLLNPPQPAEANMNDIQPFKERWLAFHAELVEDADAELSDNSETVEF